MLNLFKCVCNYTHGCCYLNKPCSAQKYLSFNVKMSRKKEWNGLGECDGSVNTHREDKISC